MSLGPTHYPEINTVLDAVLAGAQSILGNQFVGMYLCGSLAAGDFDTSSDIDFVVVTADAIADDVFAALEAMHASITASDSHWATELEGSYIPQAALRHYDPSNARHPNLERGRNERLKWEFHGGDWVIHLHILRERGIILAGPPPQTLIDPISPDDLRSAVIATLREWWAPMLGDTLRLQNRGYQSYAVLTMCRILYTLKFGAVASKRVAARWAQETLGERWSSLVDRAWVGRDHPDGPAVAEDVNKTVDFIRYVVSRANELAATGTPNQPPSP